jgi:hypothetical protein
MVRWREAQMRREIDEQEFLEFARPYLSDAFPNPKRIGCLCDWDLIEMAERPNETKHGSISFGSTSQGPAHRAK